MSDRRLPLLANQISQLDSVSVITLSLMTLAGRYDLTVACLEAPTKLAWGVFVDLELGLAWCGHISRFSL